MVPNHASGLRTINAIVRASVLEQVERRLQAIQVPGISVSRVKRYGEHANFFARDSASSHARIEIYCRRERADEIAPTICETACTGEPGDGIVVILPVESVDRVRSAERATGDELGGCSDTHRAGQGDNSEA